MEVTVAVQKQLQRHKVRTNMAIVGVAILSMPMVIVRIAVPFQKQLQRWGVSALHLDRTWLGLGLRG